jgi:hypothetical protein
MLNTFLNDLRHNLRLRLWLALIVGAVGLYGILLLRDALHNAEQQQQAVVRSVGRLQAQLTQTEWLERLPAAKILAVQLEGRLWQAPTAGLAQAALQDWLNASLIQSKATKPLITVTVLDEITAGGDGNAAPVNPPAATADGAPATPPDLWKIKAKVGFDFTPESLLAFLNRIENHDQQIIVDALSVRKEPIAHVEVQLLAYFQKQAQLVKNPTAADAARRPDAPIPAAVRP